MRPIDRLKSQLDGVKRTRSGYIARCPSHADRTPSLSFHETDDGTLLLKCFAGCSVDEICSSAKFSKSELFPRTMRHQEPIATYPYLDENEALLFEVCRYEPKAFRQRRPADDGKWQWNLSGVRRVLYRLPDLIKPAADQPVFVVEGEKDVDQLWSRGFVATTNPSGAGKWRSEYSPFLRDRDVVIIPDNDEAGRKHAEHVADSLKDHASSVRILELLGLPPKGDVTDYFARGGSVEGLHELVAATPILDSRFSLENKRESRISGDLDVTLTSLHDLLQEPPKASQWLVEGLLTADGPSLLVAKPKVGKTTLTRELAVCVSSGEPFLGRTTKVGIAVMVSLEESRERLKEAFHAMGVTDGHRLLIQTEPPPDAIRWLRAVVEKYRPAIVIIDPLLRFLRVEDANDYAQASNALDPVLRLARQQECHIMCVHHQSKGDRTDGDSVLGSTAFYGVVDTMLIMHRRDDVRTISSRQRYGLDLPAQMLRLDATTGRIAGAAVVMTEITLDQVAMKVVAALPAVGSLTENEIRAAVRGNGGLTGRAIRAGVERGVIHRSGKGAKGSPYRYSRFPVSD